jgi:uncharacterized protein (TIGR02145 family)
MKKSILLLIVFIFVSIGCESKKAKLIDIEGNNYKTKLFGKNIWMIENLRVKKDKEGHDIDYYYPNQDSSLADTFGLLYDYENACKVCPEGWHLPSNREWSELFDLFGTNSSGSFKDSLFWNDLTITNESYFSIRPAGYGNYGEFNNYFKQRAFMWSKSKVDDHYVWTYVLEDGMDSIRLAPQHPTYGFSIRCVKNN